MENLVLKSEDGHLEIRLDSNNYCITFEGTSNMNDASEIYKYVIEWIDSKGKSLLSSRKTLVTFRFDYINEETQTYLHYILTKLEELKCLINIFWYFKDEEMEEYGEHLKEYTNIPFNIVEV